MGKSNSIFREIREELVVLVRGQPDPNSEEAAERRGQKEARSAAKAAWENDQRGRSSRLRRVRRRNRTKRNSSDSRSRSRETHQEEDNSQQRSINNPRESPMKFGSYNTNQGFSALPPKKIFTSSYQFSPNEAEDQRMRCQNDSPSSRALQDAEISRFRLQEIARLENIAKSSANTETFEPEHPEHHESDPERGWNAMLERMCGGLNSLRHDCPSPRFDALVANLRSPTDLELAMKIVIQAYKDATWGRQQLERDLKELETSFETLQIKSDERLAQRTWELNEEIVRIQRESQREVGNLEGRLSAIESQFNSQEYKHEDQMHRLRGEHQREEKIQAENHELQRQRLNGDLKRLRNKYDTDMKGLRDHHEKETHANDVAAGQELARIRTELEQRLHDTKLSLSTIKETHDNEIAVIRLQNDEERSRISKDLDIEMAQMQKHHAIEVDEIVARYESEKAALVTELRTTETQYQTRLEEMDIQLQQEIVGKDRRLDALKAEHDEEKTGMRAAHEKEKVALVTDLRTAKSQYQKRLQEMDIQLQQEIVGKEKRLDALRAEHDEEKTGMRAAHEKEKVSLTRGLQESVEVLKGALVRRDHFKAMSDHELSYRFQEISSEVDDIARIHWDQRQVSTWPFTDQSFRHSENERRMKQYLIQNTLWVILYERVFCTPFRILGEEGKALEREWLQRFGSATGTSFAPILGPRPTKESEVWRYETMKNCVEATSQASGGPDPRNMLRRGYEQSVTDTAKDLCDELGRVSTISPSEKQRMADLVRKAAKLWMEIGQQRYRMFILMSETNLEATRSRPKSVNREGKLSLVVIPELRRMGNAQGEKLDKNELIMDCKGKFSIFSAS
ncbi:hypothetical protein IFR05_004807 [Cadophora sp. M221]|nr:hypothetical protein IFR05_004807 [Cadophora sp. M221]